MRAAVIERYGEPPTIRERPEPAAHDGLAVVEVTAASLNPVDLSIANRRFFAGSPPVPYVPGREGVGVVVQSSGMKPGTKVYFETHPGDGALAKRALAEDRYLVEVPTGVPDALAAALGIAGLTGWLAVEWRGRLQKGETVLVLAASGAVGMVAVQAAKILGAGFVIGAARSQEALARVRALGADATVDLNSDDLAAAFQQAAGRPIDLVIDPLWGAPAVAALQALRAGGRMVQLGQSAGAEATIASATIRGKMLTILGYLNFDVAWEIRAQAFKTLVEHAAAGRLRIDYETFPLEKAAEAWAKQASSPHKKLVVTP
jgi:NADPH:quinone reductase-like Zn-dependent oxidoreductase